MNFKRQTSNCGTWLFFVKFLEHVAELFVAAGFSRPGRAEARPYVNSATTLILLLKPAPTLILQRVLSLKFRPRFPAACHPSQSIQARAPTATAPVKAAIVRTLAAKPARHIHVPPNAARRTAAGYVDRSTRPMNSAT